MKTVDKRRSSAAMKFTLQPNPRLLLSLVAIALLAAAPVQAAVITDIRVSADSPNLGIINGVVNCDIGKNFNGARPMDLVRGIYLWRISGSGFGTLPGPVYLMGRSVPVITWSDNQIVLDPWYPSAQGPVCGILSVYPRAGGSSSSSVYIVNSCWGTVYKQCTYWVSYRRWQVGLSPASYSGASPLDANWAPRDLDYVVFNYNQHVALVESATRSSDGTWTLTMSDMNF